MPRSKYSRRPYPEALKEALREVRDLGLDVALDAVAELALEQLQSAECDLGECIHGHPRASQECIERHARYVTIYRVLAESITAAQKAYGDGWRAVGIRPWDEYPQEDE